VETNPTPKVRELAQKNNRQMLVSSSNSKDSPNSNRTNHRGKSLTLLRKQEMLLEALALAGTSWRNLRPPPRPLLKNKRHALKTAIRNNQKIKLLKENQDREIKRAVVKRKNNTTRKSTIKSSPKQTLQLHLNSNK
jgi:hypothetical protein